MVSRKDAWALIRRDTAGGGTEKHNMAQRPTAAQLAVWPLVLAPLFLAAASLRQSCLFFGSLGGLGSYFALTRVLNRDAIIIKSLRKSSHDVRVTVATVELGTLCCLDCLVLSTIPPMTLILLTAVAILSTCWLYCGWQQVRAVGLLAFASESTRKLMLNTTLLEWVQDPTFMQSLAKWKPIVMATTPSETQTVLQVTEPEFRQRLLRRGLVHDLPPGLRSLLLPAPNARALVPASNVSTTASPVHSPNAIGGAVASPNMRRRRAMSGGSGSSASSFAVSEVAGNGNGNDEAAIAVVAPSQRQHLDPDTITAALIQSRILNGIRVSLHAVPPGRVFGVAAAMSAVTWYALRQPRTRRSALKTLRRAAITTAGGTAVALWILFIVQHGVRRWVAKRPLAALVNAAVSNTAARRSAPSGSGGEVTLFSTLGRGVAGLVAVQRWIARHQRQIREHAPLGIASLLLALMLWRASKGRL